MTDLDILRNEFRPARLNASLYAKWKRDNPGEAARFETYETSVLAGAQAAPPTMQTATGRMLVAAVKMAAPEPAPPPPTVGSRKAYASGGSFPYFTDAERADELNRMAEAGAEWCRIDLPWSGIEPTRSTWRFTTFDRAIDEIRAAGLKVLGCAAYTPPWANGGHTDDKYPPLRPDDYGTFVGALADHYTTSEVAAFELGNEPNLYGFWKARLVADGPERLADMATAARAAAPGRFLVSAGLSPAVSGGGDMDPREYFIRFCVAGGGQAVDAVGFHPYYGPCPILMPKDWSAWSQMSVPKGTPTKGQHGDGGTMKLPSLRETMTANGIGHKPIWATETNMVVQDVTLDGFTATEQRQADMITEALTVWRSYPWAGQFFLYNYQHDYPRYSLRRPDGTLRPAYAAYKAA